MKKKKVLIISFLLIFSIILFLFFIKKSGIILDRLDASVINATLREYSSSDGDLNSKVSISKMIYNTVHLQKLIDDTSNNGGGTIRIPSGTYYFVAGGKKASLDSNDTNKGNFVISARDNVKIIGDGMDNTILKPYGSSDTLSNESNKTWSNTSVTYGIDNVELDNYPNSKRITKYLVGETWYGYNDTTDTVDVVDAPSVIMNGYPHGLDMFFFNKGTDSGYSEKQFLDNADYEGFTIDSEKTKGDNFNASGKGFFMAPGKNIEVRNVKVQNTDGTGFGMDLLIDTVIEDCIAINNGKNGDNNGTISNVDSITGSSGFGIGTGYTNDENVIIRNCESYGNRKFGFFFEHQARFPGTNANAESSKGFVVQNCVAGGNLYDFGGELATDLTIENSKSIDPDDVPYSKFYETSAPFHFGNASVRVNFINTKIDYSIGSVDTSKYYYDALVWALNIGLVEDTVNNIKSTTNEAYAHSYMNSDASMDKAKLLMMLHKMTGNEGITTDYTYTYTNGGIEYTVKEENGVYLAGRNRIYFLLNYLLHEVNGINDVTVTKDNSYENTLANTILWGIEKGIVSQNTNFNGSGTVTRGDFIQMLYKVAGSPTVSNDDINHYESGYTYTDISSSNVNLYKAIVWAVNEGITQPTVDNTEYKPNNNMRLGTTLTMLYRYQNQAQYNISHNGIVYKIQYNLLGGEISNAPSTYKYGTSTITIPTPTKNGYTFIGWSGSTEDGYQDNFEFKDSYQITSIDSGDKVLVANWINSSYNITLNNNSSTSPGSSNLYLNYSNSYYLDSNETIPTNSIEVPSKDNYIFDGYYTGQNGNGNKVINSTGKILTNVSYFTSDATLYANYLAIKPTNNLCKDSSELVYNGNVINLLKNNTGYGYTLTNYTGTNVGNYEITASLEDGYRWSDNTLDDTTITCTISPYDLSGATIDSVSDQIYTGSAITPTPTVKALNNTLTKDTDYTVTYSDNVNIGEATIAAAGKGNFTGTKSTTFNIVRGATVVAVPTCTAKEYTGQEQTLIENGTGYTVSNNTGTNVGNYNVTLSLVNGYIWNDSTTTDKTVTCSISLLDVSKLNISVKNETYTGMELIPIIEVIHGTNTLVENTDYTVALSDNIEVGTGHATIMGSGNYSGTVTKNFTIYSPDDMLKIIDSSVMKLEYNTIYTTLKQGVKSLNKNTFCNNINSSGTWNTYNKNDTDITDNGDAIITTGSYLKYGVSKYPIIILGDITQDGIVSIKDLYQSYLLYKNKATGLNEYQIAAGDYNRDGSTNIHDLYEIYIKMKEK